MASPQETDLHFRKSTEGLVEDNIISVAEPTRIQNNENSSPLSQSESPSNTAGLVDNQLDSFGDGNAEVQDAVPRTSTEVNSQQADQYVDSPPQASAQMSQGIDTPHSKCPEDDPDESVESRPVERTAEITKTHFNPNTEPIALITIDHHAAGSTTERTRSNDDVNVNTGTATSTDPIIEYYQGDGKAIASSPAPGEANITSPDEIYQVIVNDATPDIPDWRPATLQWLLIYLVYVSAVLFAFVGLYARSKSHGILCSDHPGIDKVFLYGPPLLGLLIGEFASRTKIDIESIQPFVMLANPTKTKRPPTSLLYEPAPRSFIFRTLEPLLAKESWAAKSSQLLTLWMTLIAIPLLSSSFSVGKRTLTTTNRQFRQANVSHAVSILEESSLPSIAVPAILNGTIYDIFPWVEAFETDLSPLGSYAGAMPYILSDDKDPTAEKDLSVSTDVFFSIFSCTPVQLHASLVSLTISDGLYDIERLDLDLDDNNGCQVQSTWNDISTSKAPSLDNPITPGGALALWGSTGNADIRAMPRNTTLTKACPKHQQFIVRGSLPTESVQGTRTLDTGAGTGWAAISCNATYYTSSGIKWPVDYQLQTSGEDPTIKNEVQLDQILSNTVQIAMARNFLQTGLVYRISSVNSRQTFWGERMYNFLTALTEIFFPTDTDCSLIPGADTNTWSDADTCEMYINAHDIWTFVAAVTATAATRYLPLDGWNAVHGSVHTSISGWYMDSFIFALVFIALLVALLIILAEPQIRFWRWLVEVPLHKEYRTGLSGPATSIAGLAFYFKDKQVRRTFSNLDAVKREKAATSIKQRLAPRRFLLRRWAEGLSENETAHKPPAYIRDFSKQIESPAMDQEEITTDPDELADLRYQELPTSIRWRTLLIIGLIISPIVVVLFVFIISPHRNKLYMWRETSGQIGGLGISRAIRRQVQHILFSGFPSLIMGILGLWWNEVDLFFRRNQPFASLAHGASGARSVALTYVHDWHGQVTARALAHGHLGLSLITFMTFLGKAGVFISGGIFKMMDTTADNQPFTAIYSAYWRNQTFAASKLDQSFAEVYRTRFNSFIMSDPRQMLAWGVNDYQFPPVRLTKSEAVMTLDGVKSNLTCTPTQVFSERVLNGSQTMSLQNPRCNTSITVAAADSSSTHPVSSMIWRYLNQDDCPGVDGGLWLILSRQPATAGDLDSTLFPNTRSLLCEPTFFQSSVELTIRDMTKWYYMDDRWANNLAVSLTGNKVEHEGALDPRRWKADGLAPLPNFNLPEDVDFPTFVSTFINATLTGTTYEVSKSTFLDSMSMITLRSAGQNESLWNMTSHDLGIYASSTFSLAMRTLLSLDFDLSNRIPFGTMGVYFNSSYYATLTAVDIALRPNSGTILLEPVKQTSPVTAQARAVLYQAVVQTAALYAAVGVLLMYLVAMPVLLLVANRSAWRTPRDVSYPANVVCMLYDSSLPDLVQVKESKGGEPVLDMSEVVKRRWGIGLFNGKDNGKHRLGIEELSSIEKVPSKYELRRRHLWSRFRKQNEDEESSK